MSLYNQPVVIDNGSGTLKAGFAGDDRPRSFGPSIVGRPKYQKIMAGSTITSDDSTQPDVFLGPSAQQNRGLLRLTHPVSHGIVENWDDMEKLWYHTYIQNLQTTPEEHPLLITEAPLNPRSNRDKMAQVLFEQMNVPCVYVSVQAVLSLYALGRTTGVVVDIGDGVSHIVPVYDGFSLPTSIQRMDVAGRDITEQMVHNIRRMSGVLLSSSSEFDIGREIKEKTCFVSLDCEKDEKNYSSAYSQYLMSRHRTSNELFHDYRLPDGHTISVGVERFRSPEILFNPEIIGHESPGIHQLTSTAISKTDMDLRPTLFQNIILSGGTTLLKNFGDRMLSEIKDVTNVPSANTKMKVKIYAPPERKYSTWIGGSILAGLSTFKKMWCTSQEFAEDPEIIHRKCM